MTQQDKEKIKAKFEQKVQLIVSKIPEGKLKYESNPVYYSAVQMLMIDTPAIIIIDELIKNYTVNINELHRQLDEINQKLQDIYTPKQVE